MSLPIETELAKFVNDSRVIRRFYLSVRSILSQSPDSMA